MSRLSSGQSSQEFTDEWGHRRRLVSGYCDLAGALLGKDLSKERIQKHPWPDPYAPERISGLNGEAQLPYQDTSYAIVGHWPMYGNLWEMTRLLVGIENALMLTITDTKLFDHLLGRMSEVVDGFYDAFLSEVGPYVQIVEFADDYVTNVGPIFNPDVYTRYFKPRYRKTIDMIKRKAPQAKVLLHCDGAMRRFIPDLIDTGFEVLNPIEDHLPGMGLAELKRDFGKDMTFQAGVDIGQVMSSRHSGRCASRGPP